MTLTGAIERREWELAALLLMLGLSRVLARLPAGTAADLLALLEAGDGGADGAEAAPATDDVARPLPKRAGGERRGCARGGGTRRGVGGRGDAGAGAPPPASPGAPGEPRADAQGHAPARADGGGAAPAV